MNCIDEVKNILEELYRHGWDERNGGNLSYLVSEQEAREITPDLQEIREFRYDFDLSSLVGRYIVMTGTGTYFRHAKLEPNRVLGLLKIKDKNTMSLLWGFEGDGRPTSEAPTHLKSHMERLKADPLHRLIIHCHPTNVIALSHVLPNDDKIWTSLLWRMQTESLVVFPEGVAVLPWMLCGGDEIGEATAKRMKDVRAVVWGQHGLFAAGRSLDETYGLIETIEKAADIYMKIYPNKCLNLITDQELRVLAKAFGVNYRKGVID